MRRDRATLVVMVVFAVVAARLLWSIYQGSVNILFMDQWDLYDVLFENKNGWETFFRQGGNHRQGVIFVIDMWLAQMTHWNTIVEAVFVGALMVGAGYLALRLKKALFGKYEYSDVIIPVVCLSLVPYESFIATPFPSLSVFPLLMVFGYCLAWAAKNGTAKYVVIGLVNFLLVFSGYGWIVGLVTPGLLVLSYGDEGNRKWRLIIGLMLVGSVASLVGLVTGLDMTIDPTTLTRENWGLVVPYMVLLFGNFFRPTKNLDVVIAGGVGYLVMGGILFLRSFGRTLLRGTTKDPTNVVLVILLSMTGLYTIFNLAGRVGFNIFNALASRYGIFYIPGLVAIYFGLLRWGNIRIAKLGKGVMMGIVVGIYLLSFASEEPGVFSAKKRAWRDCYLSHENIEFCDTTTDFMIYPNTPNKAKLKAKLDYLKNNKLNLFY